MVQLSLSPVVSQNLFSQNYLQDRLKEMPIWRELDHEMAFEKVKWLYDKEKGNLERYNEAQLEDHFIKPVLRILGHAFEVQAESGRSALTPDYAFFSDDAARVEALPSKGEKGFYAKAVAVGDAKKWGTPLDKKSGERAKYAQDNPSFQIDIYLRDMGLQWGILTNGRYWRIYYEKTSHRLDSYFEVDLATILDAGSKSGFDPKIEFKFFYLFFRREAFLKDATGKNVLQHTYDESYNYAKRVEDSLEKSVYKALRVLAQGFFAWPTNSLKPDPGTIDLVHRNCLILLYRLLFILYADSKGTLRVRDNEYFDINKIKFKAFTGRRAGTLTEHAPEFWNKLNEIFALIDEGSEARGIKKEELYIPPYNGGLFDRREHSFLNEKKVGDRYLAEVLEFLTMNTEGEMPQSIDYSPLEIRHLGSIYEGLLEYKIRVAEEDLVAVKEKDKQVWIPKEKAQGKKLDEAQKGELYLVTDKGERKATGSYYTPDYIVKYIVENTLGPVVEEKLKGARTNEEKIEAILSIKVLDPAMGSGHFLVEATEYLAKRIIPFLDPEKLGEEKEIEWARREVAKRCIHGVDLNPLATELAKLSLWLSTFEPNRPLSFLDHHLRVGNSLIGADIRHLGKHPTEVESSTAPTFISDFMDKEVQEKIEIFANMHLAIMRMAEESVKDIKLKEATYEQFRADPFRQAFKQLANLHTSYWLGNKYSKDEYYEALEAFRQFSRDRSKWEKVREREYFKRAQELAEEKRFFHWMLAFPDIFFGERQENPGFDAVVGNPPYVRIYRGTISEEDASYYPRIYKSAHMKFDLYVLFIELSLALLRARAYFSMIVPDKFMTSPYGGPIRDILLGNKIISLLDVRDRQVFEGVAVNNVVPVVSKNKPDKSWAVDLIRLSPENTPYAVSTFAQENFQNFPDKQFRIDANSSTLKIRERIDANAISLGSICYVNWGLRTGTAEKTQEMITSQPPGSSSKLLIRGEDIEDRYSLNFANDRYIDYDPSRLYNPMFPEFFENEKLVFRKISGPKGLMAVYDDQNLYGFSTVIICVNHRNLEGVKRPGVIPPPAEAIEYKNLRYVLVLCNSSLVRWYYTQIFSDNLSVVPNQIKALPIRRISFTTPQDRRAALVEEAKALYSTYLSSSDSRKLLDFVGMRLDAKPEESDIVHDLLAFLAERMIETNKEKNAEIKGFLGWLEREVGAKVEDLQNKTTIKEYYDPDHPFEELVKVLKKNKAKLSTDPGRREFQEKLKQEYDSSTSKLGPLLAKIENTDLLIDQIVYRLYGLTGEEIKVVEGAGG
ncbi:MAG: N-6 DNA methylase [Euryarchaeota archaeon]|nr:N-6 DNA methylase [Euryarchaeota archaeon]